jgi:hypothetical protein
VVFLGLNPGGLERFVPAALGVALLLERITLLRMILSLGLAVLPLGLQRGLKRLDPGRQLISVAAGLGATRLGLRQLPVEPVAVGRQRIGLTARVLMLGPEPLGLGAEGVAIAFRLAPGGLVLLPSLAHGFELLPQGLEGALVLFNQVLVLLAEAVGLAPQRVALLRMRLCLGLAVLPLGLQGGLERLDLGRQRVGLTARVLMLGPEPLGFAAKRIAIAFRLAPDDLVLLPSLARGFELLPQGLEGALVFLHQGLVLLAEAVGLGLEAGAARFLAVAVGLAFDLPAVL